MATDLPMETHPWEPFMPENARILICGTFPPTAQRWSMNFYYPNFINDMWRIFGIIFFHDKDYLVDAPNKTFKLDAIKQLLLEKGIAMSDTGKGVIREKGNASDKYLQILHPIDLVATLSGMPECVAVATTGEKAASVIAGQTATPIPPTGGSVECSLQLPDGSTRKFTHWRMPSSSRAYPLKLEKKAEAYGRMFKELGILNA